MDRLHNKRSAEKKKRMGVNLLTSLVDLPDKIKAGVFVGLFKILEMQYKMEGTTKA